MPSSFPSSDTPLFPGGLEAGERLKRTRGRRVKAEAPSPALADLVEQIALLPPALAPAAEQAAPMAAPTPPAEPAPKPASETVIPFAQWLLAQDKRGGWIGQLAKGAKADRAFPRRGSPDEVRAHLSRSMAEGDVFEAVDDAERDWLRHAA